MILFPGVNFIFVNEYIIIFYPSRKFVKSFRVVVLTHTGADVKVPLMYTTYQIVSFHVSVFKQRASVQTPAV